MQFDENTCGHCGCSIPGDGDESIELADDFGQIVFRCQDCASGRTDELQNALLDAALAREERDEALAALAGLCGPAYMVFHPELRDDFRLRCYLATAVQLLVQHGYEMNDQCIYCGTVISDQDPCTLVSDGGQPDLYACLKCTVQHELYDKQLVDVDELRAEAGLV